MANWTVMVYFAGDNNLSEEMIYAIKEMYRIGVTKDFNVIAQFDPSAIGAPVRRYVITKRILDHVKGSKLDLGVSQEGKVSRLDADGTIEQLGLVLLDEGPNADVGKFETQLLVLGLPPNSSDYGRVQKRPDRRSNENSADPRVLTSFIEDSIKHHGATHTMLVLSGHGNGAIGDCLADSAAGGTTPTSLSIPRLNGVLEKFKGKISILGMDSCLMSMAEVGFELRASGVKYVVGSEGSVLNTGWPYHRILDVLINNPTIGETKLATTIVEKYISYYGDYEAAGASTDQSVCDIGKFGELEFRDPMRNLVGALIRALDHSVLNGEIVLAHWEAQSYKGEQYTDLYDFCDRLQTRCLALPEVSKILEVATNISTQDLKHADDTLKEKNKSAFASTHLSKEDDKTAIPVSQEKAKETASVLEKTKSLLELLSKKGGTGRTLGSTIKDLSDELTKLATRKQERLDKASRPFLVPKETAELLTGISVSVASLVAGLIVGCGEVKDAINRIVLRSSYTGPGFQHSHGLSVYFPWFEDEEVLRTYHNLEFAKKTGWDKFLTKYVRTTARGRRNQEGHDEPPLRIAPSAPLIVLAPLAPPRRSSVDPRGFSGPGSMKNPPDGFYREK